MGHPNRDKQQDKRQTSNSHEKIYYKSKPPIETKINCPNFAESNKDEPIKFYSGGLANPR